MNYKSLALGTVKDAEERIAAFVREAVDNGHYEHIPLLAEIARSLAQLRTQHDGAGTSLDDRQSVAATPSVPLTSTRDLPDRAPGLARARRRTAPTTRVPVFPPLDLPRFEREENRLVKIGWSARDERTYEHRVPKPILDAVAAELTKQVHGRKPFKMEKLIPMKDATGAEIPSYQAYLVLKWLQEGGVVERRGNDGYIFCNRDFGPAELEALWNKTSPRPTPT